MKNIAKYMMGAAMMCAANIFWTDICSSIS